MYSYYCHVLKSNKRLLLLLLLLRLLLPIFALTSTSQSFSPDLKLSCVSQMLGQSSSLSAFIRTAFTDLGTGPDLLDTGVLFVLVTSFFIFLSSVIGYLRVLDTLTVLSLFSVHIKTLVSYRIHIGCILTCGSCDDRDYHCISLTPRTP